MEHEPGNFGRSVPFVVVAIIVGVALHRPGPEETDNLFPTEPASIDKAPAFGTRQAEAPETPVVSAKQKRAHGFQRFIEARRDEHDANHLGAQIAGVTYPSPDGRSRQDRIQLLEPMDELTLVQEPANRFSDHAVAVFSHDGFHLGYIPERVVRDIWNALASGGFAVGYVRSITPVSAGYLNVAIDVIWRAKLSPRNEFRRTLDKLLKEQAEEWFWAKLAGLDKVNPDGSLRQEIIALIKPRDSL
jgi:hypothetical protein